MKSFDKKVRILSWREVIGIWILPKTWRRGQWGFVVISYTNVLTLNEPYLCSRSPKTRRPFYEYGVLYYSRKIWSSNAPSGRFLQYKITDCPSPFHFRCKFSISTHGYLSWTWLFSAKRTILSATACRLSHHLSNAKETSVASSHHSLLLMVKQSTN